MHIYGLNSRLIGNRKTDVFQGMKTITVTQAHMVSSLIYRKSKNNHDVAEILGSVHYDGDGGAGK